MHSFIYLLIFAATTIFAFQVEFGENVSQHFQKRCTFWLSQVPQQEYILQIGNTKISQQLIPAAELAALGAEAYMIRQQNNIIAVNGNPSADSKYQRGVAYGMYDVLQQLGIVFTHPFRPTLMTSAALRAVQNKTEVPHWLTRGIHIHTEHPLEVTEMLNGMAKNLSLDRNEWNKLLPEWDNVLEWLVANKQNTVEWVLLYADNWKDFADSQDRQARLQVLNNMAHEYLIETSADVPIVEEQQHAWRLIRELGDPEKETQQLYMHLDYLMVAGFDYVGTELGFSEFTHGDATKMVLWLNQTAAYLDEKYKKRAFSKVHISQGQKVQEYIDPLTHQPGCNFNFLPYYSDQRMGIMPHTVQFFSFDDPAYTYGAQNFTFMKEFIFLELGKRFTLWYPETAYWVNFDINVPLFLAPLYTYRRFADVRTLARRERLMNQKLDGQIFFSSGWEFGYWLNDVLAMKMSWNPNMQIEDDSKALELLVSSFFQSILDSNLANAATEQFISSMTAQYNALVLGKIGDKQPSNLSKKSGIAYMAGYDTWANINDWIDLLFKKPMQTQPPKFTLIDVMDGLHTNDYATFIRPMLEDMMHHFNATAFHYINLQSQMPANVQDLFSDMADSAQLTYLRASQVYLTYEAAYAKNKHQNVTHFLQLAKQSILDATQVVKHRVEHFRIADVDRIVGWRTNPTAYKFGYLFQARTLFFWWRDLGIVLQTQVSPCYMNIIDPIDIAIGEGIADTLGKMIRQILEKFPAHVMADCLSAPKSEPHIPPF